MTEPLYFDQLSVGDRWRSRARTVTQADVVNFAGLTGDYDPLHTDHEFAKQTPFGQPIAHGLLGLSMVAGLGSHYPLVQTVAFVAIHQWEFLLPIYFGDTVHAVNEVTGLQPSGRRRGTVLWKRQLVNQKGQVVQAGVFETLVARSGGKRAVAATVTAVPEKPPAKRSRRKRTDAAAVPAKPHSPRGRSRKKVNDLAPEPTAPIAIVDNSAVVAEYATP